MSIWLKYIIVLLWGMWKFAFAPVSGYLMELHWLESMIMTSIGMMLTFMIISIIGEKFKRYIKKRGRKKNKKLFCKRNRMIVRVWSRFGIQGICFLTPVVLSPIVGSIFAVGLEKNIRKTWFYMTLSTIFWALTFSLVVELGGERIVHWLS